MTRIHVTASRGYDVLLEEGLLDGAGAELRRVLPEARSAAIAADETVSALYGERLAASLERAGFRTVSFPFPAGEGSKTLATYAALLNFLGENALTRGDALLALGGGVAGDLAGFAAATYRRGIPFCQVPTSLLAAVDSSVGGKTGIDLPTGKNQAGCFCQPSLVLCDPALLTTLPAREYRSGCAEVIKYGVLFDGAFFTSLEETPVKDQMEAVATKIAGFIGENEGILIGGEKAATFKSQSRAMFNAKQLKAEDPELWAKYAGRSEPSRVLRVF